MALLSAAFLLLLNTLSAQAAIITVGAGKDYATLNAAIANAAANDEIRIDAGVYVNDYSTINVPLTIVGVGGLAVLDANAAIPNGKAILVSRANVTIRNLEFRDASVPDRNGAGIRHELGDLTVEDSIFRNNEDGILTASGADMDLIIRRSQFIESGFGDGFSHAVYAFNINSLTVEDSVFSQTLVGHDIKSRSNTNIIRNNILDDGVSGTTSYAIDLSNCGVAQVTGNQITQGPNTQNPSMLAYGAEGCTKPVNSLLVEGNSFANSKPGTSIGVHNFTSTVVAVLRNNTLDDGVTGTTSYAIDLSNCGVAEVTGNAITQGPNTQNPSMLAYGAEGCTKPVNSLLVADNTFTNTKPGTSIGVHNFTSTVVAVLRNNTFTGLSENVRGPHVFVGPVDPDPDPTPVSGPLPIAVLGVGLVALALRRAPPQRS